MKRHLDGTWQDFERWIERTVGSRFRWKVRPMDTVENRRTVASLVQELMDKNKGNLPEQNAFIELVRDEQTS